MKRLRSVTIKNTTLNVSLVLAIVWLVFTLALVGWWIWMLDSVLSQFELGTLIIEEQIPKLKKMIFWEGLTLFALIIIGAVPLIYLINREKMRSSRFKEFFANFSHDIKTSIASLKLQVECLEDEMKSGDDESKRLLTGILSDAHRLQHQLDNSLLVAQMKAPKVFLESVMLKDFILRLQYQWPQLSLQVEGDAQSKIDRRLFENALSNLCKNSLVHGKATKGQFKIIEHDSGVIVTYSDNGSGFDGEVTELTKPFSRTAKTSGTGLGLYLVNTTLKSMGGEFNIIKPGSGFHVEMKLLKGGADV